MSRHTTAATPGSPLAPDDQPRPLTSRSLDSDTTTNGSSPGFHSGPQSPRPLPRAPAYLAIAESPLNWEGAAEDSSERLSSYDFWNPYATQPLRRARAPSGLTAAVQRREGGRPRQAAQAARGARRAAAGGPAPPAASGGQSSIGSASSLPPCSEPGSLRGSNDVDGGPRGLGSTPGSSSVSGVGSGDAPPRPSGSGTFGRPSSPSSHQPTCVSPSLRKRKSWRCHLAGLLVGLRRGLDALRWLGAGVGAAARRARDGLTHCVTLALLGCQALWRFLALQVGRIRLRPSKVLMPLALVTLSLFCAHRRLPVVLLLLWCLALAAEAAQKGGPRRDLLTTGTAYSRVAFTLHSGSGARFSSGIEAAGTNLSTLLDGNHWVELPEGASFDVTFSLVHDYAEDSSASIELGSDCKVVATLAPGSSALAYGEFFDASNLPEGDLYYDLNTDFREVSTSNNQWTIGAKDNGIADGDRMFPLTFHLSCDAGLGAQVWSNDTLYQYYVDLFSEFPALQIMVIVTDDDDLGVLGTGGLELEPGSSCVLGVSLSTEPPTATHVPLEVDWYTAGVVLDDIDYEMLANNPSITSDQISRYSAQGRLALSGEETRDLGPRDDPSDPFPRLRFTRDNWPSSQAILLRAPETEAGMGRAVDVELYSRLDPDPITEDEVTKRYGVTVSDMDSWGVAVGQEYPDSEYPGYNVEILSSAYMVNATGIVNAFPLVTVLGPLVLNDTSRYLGEKYSFSMTEGSIVNVTLGLRLADVGANIGANLSLSSQDSASPRLQLVDYSSGEAVLVSDLLISAADIGTTFGLAAIDNTDTGDTASFLLSISYYDSGLAPYVPFAGIMGSGATQILISIVDEDEAAFMESPTVTPYLHETDGETSLGFRPVAKPNADVTVTPVLYLAATTYGPDGAPVFPPLKIAGEHVPGHTSGEWVDLRSLATPGSFGPFNITLRDIAFSPDNFSDPAFIRVEPYKDGLLASYTFWLDFGDVASEDVAYRNLSQNAASDKYTFYYYILNDEPRALLVDGTSNHTYYLASFNPLPPQIPPAPTSISFNLTFGVPPSADVAVRLYARGIYRPGSPRVTYTLNDTYGSSSTGSFTFEDFAPFDGCRLAYFNESSDPYDYETLGPVGTDCGPLRPPYVDGERFFTYEDGQVVYMGIVTVGAGNGSATVTLEVPWDEFAVPRQSGPYGDTLTYVQAVTNAGTKMIPIPFGIQLEAIVHDTIAPEYPLEFQLPVLGTVLLREAAQAGIRVEQASFGSSDFSVLSGDILGNYRPPTTFIMESTGLQLRLSLNTEPFYPVMITVSIGWLPPGAERDQAPVENNRLHLANGAWGESVTLASLSDTATLLFVAPDNLVADGDTIVSVVMSTVTLDPFYAAQGYQRRFRDSVPTAPDFSLSQVYILQAVNTFQFPLAVHILVIDDDVSGLAVVKGAFSDASPQSVAFQSAMQVKEGDSCLLRLALSSEPADPLKVGVNATFADAFHFPYDAAGLDNPFDNLTIYANSSLWEAYSGVSADGWVAWGPRPVFYPEAWEAQQVLELTWPENKLMSPAGFNGVVLGLTLEDPSNYTVNGTYPSLDGYYYGAAPEMRVDYEGFVTAAVVDDERIGVFAVAPSAGRWAVEGQAAGFNLSLASEPQSDVQIRVTGLCTFGYNNTYGQPLYHRVTNLTITTPVLVFTPNNWDAPQNVTFSTESDVYYSNYLCEFYFSAVSEDLAYNEMPSQRYSFVLWDDREQALLFSGQIEAPMNVTIAEDASWAYLYENATLDAFYANNRSVVQTFTLLSSPLPGSQVLVQVIPYNTSSESLSRRRLAEISGDTTRVPSASILAFEFPDLSFATLWLQAGVNMTEGFLLQFNESTWNVPYPIVIRSPADNVLGASSSEVSSLASSAFTEYLFGAHLLYNYWDNSLNDYSIPQPTFSLRVLEGDRAGLRLRSYGASRVDLGGGSQIVEFNTSILLGESVTFVNPDDLQHGFPILVSGSEVGGLFSVSTMTDLGAMGLDSTIPLFVSLRVTAWPECTGGNTDACPPLPYFGTVSSHTPSISGTAVSNSGPIVHSVDVELTGSGLREVFFKLYYPFSANVSSLPMLRLTATIKAAQAAALPTMYLNGYGLPSGSYTDLLVETVDSPALQALVGFTTNGIIQIQEGSGCLAEVSLATSDTAADVAIRVYAEPLAVPGEEGLFPQNDWTPWGIARLFYTTAPEVDPAGTAQGPTSFLVPLYALDDRVSEGNAGFMVTIQAESLTEAPYRLPLLSIPSLVAVGIVENDGPGIDAAPVVLGQTSFNETDSFIFFARLTSSPALYVILTPVIDFVVFEYNGEEVQPVDSTDYILKPSSYNFTASDWDAYVTFNFTIVRTDKLPVDRQVLIKFTTAAEEPVYNGTTWPTYLNLTLINIDEPRPCFNALCRLGFSTNVTEGSSVPLELFLMIPPAAQETVTLTLNFGSSVFSTELSFTDPASTAATFTKALTFTESDYDKGQPFTIYSIDNEYYDRNVVVSCEIVLSSASVDGYRTYPITQTFAFTVNLLENDAFSIVFSPASVTVREDDGLAQSVAVSLGSKPRSLVTLTLITDGLTTGGTGTDLMTSAGLDTRVITSTKTIVFDPASGDSFWSTPHTVTFSPNARDSIQRLPSGSVIQYGWNITQTAAFNPMNGLSNRDAGLESNVFLVDYEEADTALLVRSPSPVATLELYEIPGGLYGFEVNVSLATIPLGPVKLTPSLTADPISYGRSSVATIPTLGFSPPYIVFASANYSTVSTFLMTIEADYRIQSFSSAALGFTIQSLEDPFYANLNLAAGGWNANLTDLSVAKLCQENSKTECIMDPVLGFLIGDTYDISLRPAYEPKETVTVSFASVENTYFTMTPKAALIWTQSNWTNTVNVTIASKAFAALQAPVRVTVNATASSTDTAWTHGNVLEIKFTVSSYSTETDGLFAPGSPLLLSLGSGLSLNISGSALNTSASIAMAYLVQDDLDNLGGLAGFVQAYKYFFSLTPHGTAFAEDVEFCAPIPTKNGAPDTENMRIFKAPSQTSSAWTVVQISKPLKTLSANLQCAPCKVSSFSVVAFTAASSSIVATPNQGGTPVTYIENAIGVPIWPSMALTALSGTLAVRAEVAFSSCIGATDQIILDPAYNSTGGWSVTNIGSCTGANPVAMVLVPTSTPAGLNMASLQTALRSVWFTQDNEDDPAATTRSFTLTILEDDYVGYYSTSASSFVAQAVVVPVNDPPKFRNCTAGSIGKSVVYYTEKQSAVSLLPSGCEIYDPEASGIQSMVVSVSPVDSAGHDVFTFPSINTTYPALTSTYVSATNTWTVTTKNGLSAGSTEYTGALALATFRNPGLKIVSTNRTVTVVLTDAGNSTQTSVHYMNITLVNDPPAPLAGNAYTLTEDVPLTASYASWGADPEGDKLEIVVQCSPSKGTITFDYPNQLFTYTPNTNEYGSDVLVYTVSDTVLEDTIDLQLVTFTITDVPDNPIFQADSCNFGYTPAVRSTVATSQDFSMADCFTDPDGPDGQLASLVIDATDSVFLGAYTFTIPSGTFTPTAANPTVTLLYSDATYSFTFSYAASRINLKNGGSIYSSDTLQLTATDKTGRVTTGSLTMTITSSSKAPTGVGNNVTVPQGSKDIPLLLECTPASSSDTTTCATTNTDTVYTLVTSPPATLQGSLRFVSGSNNRLLYTPNAFKYGTDYFTFIVSADGIVFSAETRYNVTATFVNIAPQLACSDPLTPDFSLFADDSLRLELLAGPLQVDESRIAWESSPWELLKDPTSPYNSWVKVVASLVPTASYNSDHAYGKKAMERFLLHYTVGLMFYAGKQLNDGTLYFAVESDTTSDSRLQMEKPDPVFVNHYVCSSQSDLPVPMSYPDRWTTSDGGAMSYGTPAGGAADQAISVETGRPFLDRVPVFNGVRFVIHAYDPDENATMTYRIISLPVHGSLFYVDPDQVVAYLEATNQNKDTLGVAMELPPMREGLFLTSNFLKNITTAGQEIKLVQPLNVPDGQVGPSIWDPINLIYLPNEFFAGAPVDFMQWQAIDSQGNVSEVSTVRFFASCPQGFTRTDPLAPLTGLPVLLNVWKCVKCNKGTHAAVSQNLGSGKSFDQGAGSCQSCLLGQAQSLYSQISCNTCDLNTYQDTPASETCKACPDPSMESNKGSTAVSQCICKTGFFPNKVSANASITCAQCDASTQICEKGQSYPLPARVGIYIDPNDGTRVEQCLVVEACPMWTDPLFVKNGSCARGYESSLCAKCALRYYRSNGICKKCASNAWIIYIGAGAALCIIIPIFFKLAQFDVFASINIIVAYLQALSVFRNFKFQWPPQLLRFLNLISVFNIQIDLVAPECSVRKWKYVNKIWISYLIPLGFIIIFIFYYVIVRTKDKRRARARARISPVDRDHADRHSIGFGKPSTPDKRTGSSQGPVTARVAPMPLSDIESYATKPPPSPPRPGSPSAYPDAYGGGGGGGYGQDAGGNTGYSYPEVSQPAGGNDAYGYPAAYQQGAAGAQGYSYAGISTADPYGASYGAGYGQQQGGYAPASADPDPSQPGTRRGVQFADDREDDPGLAPSARSRHMSRKTSMKKAPRDIQMYPDVVIQNTAELNLGANTRVERMGWSTRGTQDEHDDDDKAKPRGLVRMDIRLRKGLAGFLVFLSFTYFMLASATAEYFNCKKIGSATVSSPTGGASTTTRAGYYMTKDSSTRCWDFKSPNIHLLLLPAAIAAIFFYVIGIPLIYGILLHSVRPVLMNRTEIKKNITYKDKQKDFNKKELRTKNQLEAAEQSIGFLFKRYKDVWYFWEILIVLRKLSFTVMLFLGQIEQILSITAVCIVYITALFFARPYNVAHLNYMEMVAMTMCVLIIYCGYFFYSDLLSPSEIDYLAIVIQILLISSIVILVGFVIYDISPKIQGVFRQLRMAKNYKRLRAQARAAMARGSARALKTMSVVLRKEDEVEHNIHKRVKILWIKLRALAHFTIPPRKKFILNTFKKVLAPPTMAKFRPWLLQVATPEQVEEAYFTAEIFDKYFSPVKERLDELESDHLIKLTHAEKIEMKEAEGNALMTRALRTMSSMHRNNSRLRARPDDHERVDDWQLLKNIVKEYINSRREYLRRQLELLAKSTAASAMTSRAASTAAVDRSNKSRKGKSRKEGLKSEAVSENEASITELRSNMSRPKSLTATQLKKLEQDAAQQALAKNRLFKWVLGKLGAEDEVVERAESTSQPVVQCVKPERYYRTQGIFQMSLAPAILEVAAFYAEEPDEDGQVLFKEEDRAAINQIVRAIAGAEDDVAQAAYDGLYKQGTRFVLVDLSGFEQSHIEAILAQQERDYRPNFYPMVNMETHESVALPTEELPFVSMNKSAVFEEPEEQRVASVSHAAPSGDNMFATFTGSGRISNVEAHGAFGAAAQRRASVDDQPAQPAVTNSRPPAAGSVPDMFYEGAEPPGSVGSPKEGLGRTTGPGNGASGGGGTGTNTNGSSTPKGPPQPPAAAVALGHASQPQGSLLGSATGSPLGGPVDPRAASGGGAARTGTVDLQTESDDFF